MGLVVGLFPCQSIAFANDLADRLGLILVGETYAVPQTCSIIGHKRRLGCNVTAGIEHLNLHRLSLAEVDGSLSKRYEQGSGC